MNQKQRAYAMERISALQSKKVNEITEKFTTPSTSLCFDEKVQLIRNRKVSLKPGPFQSYVDLADAFDFSKHEKKKFYDEAKAKPIITKIAAKVEKVRDNIMLADGTEALATIKDFEKFIQAI